MKGTGKDLGKDFFFIIGRPRSGTTMMRMLFDAHPNTLVPPESPVILRLYIRHRRVKKWTKPKLEKFYHDLLNMRKFNLWEIDCEKLKTDLLALPENTTLQEIFQLVYSSYQSVFDKKEIKILGDKNPAYSLFLKKILKIYPNAKIIYITRDYRDHILSMIRVQLLVPSVFLFAYRYKISARRILKLKNKKAEQFYTLKYEDFVRNPEPYLKEMCAFINIDYQPEMLNYHEKEKEVKEKYPKEKFDLFFGNLFHPINPNKVDGWKTKMSEKDIKKADTIVGKYAEILGYERKYKGSYLFIKLDFTLHLIKMSLMHLIIFLIRKTPVKIKKFLGLENQQLIKIFTNLNWK
jgi:hypothetical protein